MILSEDNRSIRRKECYNATLSVTDLTWSGLRSNPGLRGVLLFTYRLILCLTQNTACFHLNKHVVNAVQGNSSLL
jgi:hypothetical protein